jgi:hypothetical protein
LVTGYAKVPDSVVGYAKMCLPAMVDHSFGQ